MSRIAVVLFNLGGPDKPDAVEPFLFNLFNDPAIIGLPNPFRWLLAKTISKRRAPVAKEIYANIGGRSPLLPLTEKQAAALEAELADKLDVKVFIAMRYWHPFAAETAAAVKAWGPEQIILLPLYPQFSTTTGESSIRDWRRAAKACGLDAPTVAVCCYPLEKGLVQGQAAAIRTALVEAKKAGVSRVLFSAHGLPKKIIAKGDPYQQQVERTTAAVVAELAMPDLDWIVCYQSRVGPLEWIGPATDAELERAGRDGVAVVVVPIAFVSEHSETLVELDIEYRHLAEAAGVKAYVRVPALGTDAAFVRGLARLVESAAEQTPGRCWAPERPCDARFGRCAYGTAI